MVILPLLVFTSNSFSANTHGLRSAQREAQARWGDAFAGYVVTGCAPEIPTSSLTMVAFGCDAYTVDGGELVYVTQPSAAVTIADATPTWLAIHRDRTTSVAGWTRQARTHYIYQQSASQPATPSGALIFAKVTVAASIISDIEFLRYSNPLSPSSGWISITDAPFGAVGDDSTDNTTAIQAAIDAAERAGDDRLCLRVPIGIFRHTGLTFTKGLCLEGAGWGAVLKNTSTTNHSISRVATGTGDTETQAIRIANLKLTHTCTTGTDAVDGIHIEETSKFIEIHRVYVDVPCQDGIYLSGTSAVADGDSTYAYITHNWVSTNAGNRDSLSITGSANAGVIIGGRYDNTGRYGISIADANAGDPNGWFVAGVDVPGDCDAVTYTSCAPLHDNGNDNTYFMIRFEGTDSGRPDIYLGADSTHAQFFGNSHSTTANAFIDDSADVGTPDWKAYGHDYSTINPVHPNGYLGYYDRSISGCATGNQEIAGCRRDLPKLGRLTATIESEAAATATLTRVLGSCESPLTLVGAKIIPQDNMTGNDTNYVRLQILIADDTTQTLRSIRHFDFTTGNDLTQYDEFDLFANGVDGGSENCDTGDVWVWQRVKNGTGLLHPQLVVQLTFEGGEH